MEGAPTNEGLENSEWKSLKEEAELKAENLISRIEGYEEMEDSKKMESLKSLLEMLQDDNDNRFVAEVIANKISVDEENLRHTERMSQLEGET